MKKLFGFAMVAICAVCLTGCGNSNELKCTGEIDGQKATVKATLKSDKITKVVVESSEEAESAEEAKAGAAMINGFGSMAGEGMTMSAKANGKKVTMTITMDIAKMSSDDIEDQLGTAELTKDAFVKAMEEEGMTCK